LFTAIVGDTVCRGNSTDRAGARYSPSAPSPSLLAFPIAPLQHFVAFAPASTLGCYLALFLRALCGFCRRTRVIFLPLIQKLLDHRRQRGVVVPFVEPAQGGQYALEGCLAAGLSVRWGR